MHWRGGQKSAPHFLFNDREIPWLSANLVFVHSTQQRQLIPLLGGRQKDDMHLRC